MILKAVSVPPLGGILHEPLAKALIFPLIEEGWK